MGAWGGTFRTVWERAEARGEVHEPVAGTAVSATASAPILQRWLFSPEPVTEAFADEVLADVVLPLISARNAA
jgi:hypothetical protein